jgi:poly(hydroxyalkanoate) depolymerase family esterase
MAILRGKPAASVASQGRPDAGPAGAQHKIPPQVKSILDRLGKMGHPSAPPTVAPGASFIDRSFTNEAGTRAYKLYIPSGYDGSAVPLVLMLHGCTQSPDDFATGTGMNTVAEEQTFLVAYPAQSQQANAQKCWNWFDAKDQKRGMGELSLLAGIASQVIAEHSVDTGQVYAAGLSAGAAAAVNLGQAYPDLFAAVGVHSGLACGAARDMPSAFAAMKQGAAPQPRAGARRVVPTIVFHGDQDGTVNPVNADHVAAQARQGAALATTSTRGTSDGGLDFTRTVHETTEGKPVLEQWVLHGAGHAWSGGSAAGSYTEPRGPDASREMMRFFAHHTGR